MERSEGEIKRGRNERREIVCRLICRDAYRKSGSVEATTEDKDKCE